MLKSLTSPRVLAVVMVAMLSLPPASTDAQPVEGIVVPSKQVVLNAPLPAILKEFAVKEGDRVEINQPLAYMDDALQQVSVQSAQMQAESTTAIRNAELVFEDAQIQVERILEAEKMGAASEWEVRRTRLQAETAAAQVEQAREQQQLAQIQLQLEIERLKRYAVFAPFAGRVLRTNAEAGASLTQQDALLTLVAMHPLEAQFHLPREDYGQLVVGQTYPLYTGDSKDATTLFNATLKTIDPVIDPASQTFRVVFTIDNVDESLPSGFPAWFGLDRLVAPAVRGSE